MKGLRFKGVVSDMLGMFGRHWLLIYFISAIAVAFDVFLLEEPLNRLAESQIMDAVEGRMALNISMQFVLFCLSVVVLPTLHAALMFGIVRNDLAAQVGGAHFPIISTLRRSGPLILLSTAVLLLVVLGALLLVIPGIFAFTVYLIATPILLNENLKVRDTLDRCLSLSSGHRWCMFSLAIFGLAIVATPIAIMFISPIAWSQIAYEAASLVLTILLYPVFPVMSGVIYFHLAEIDQSGLKDKIADVFE